MLYIDEVLENNNTGFTYDEILKEHIIQIKFFAHERLIHLLVTIAFAMLAFGTFFMTVIAFKLELLLLLFAILILLVPYIMHYYLLENGVQRMYDQYDELNKLIRNTKDK